MSVQSKFEEIRKSNQAAAQRLVETHISSSSSEDDDDDDDGAGDHEDGKRGKILASTFTTYTDQTGEPGVTIVTAQNPFAVFMLSCVFVQVVMSLVCSELGSLSVSCSSLERSPV